jgi:hypothetical protein
VVHFHMGYTSHLATLNIRNARHTDKLDFNTHSFYTLESSPVTATQLALRIWSTGNVVHIVAGTCGHSDMHEI